jgi:ribosomal protein S18 acetylase RimI-like enzyme
MLARRGYALAATTDVLVRTVADEDADGLTGVPEITTTMADDPTDAWMLGWLAVKAPGAQVDTAVAQALVGGSPALYVTAHDADGVVGVLRAAFAADWVGLSCLMVAPRARRRGIARLLTTIALREAGERGVVRAFLQVEAANAVAAALYESMGFRPAQRYHYRQH